MYGCSVDGVDLRSEDGMVSFSVHSAGIWFMVYGIWYMVYGMWCMYVVLTSVLRMAGGRMVLTVYTVQPCSAPQSVAGCLPAMWHTAPPLHHNQGHV